MMNKKNNVLWLLAISTLVFSCSTLKKVQRENGMNTRKVKLKDLGSNYQGYRGTDFDYFTKAAPENERIKIYYRTFKMKKFDQFNLTSSVLYTKFLFAQKINRQFDQVVNSLLKKGIYGETRRSLRRSIRKGSVKHLKTVQRLDNSYESLKLSLKVLKELIQDARTLVKDSDGLISRTKKTFINKPDKGILIDKMLSESKRTLKRLKQVITESPKLITSITDQLKISEAINKAKKL